MSSSKRSRAALGTGTASQFPAFDRSTYAGVAQLPRHKPVCMSHSSHPYGRRNVGPRNRLPIALDKA